MLLEEPPDDLDEPLFDEPLLEDLPEGALVVVVAAVVVDVVVVVPFASPPSTIPGIVLVVASPLS